MYGATEGGSYNIAAINFNQDVAETNQQNLQSVVIGHSSSNTGTFNPGGALYPIIGGIGVTSSPIQTFTFANKGAGSISGTFTLNQDSLVVLVAASSQNNAPATISSPFTVDQQMTNTNCNYGVGCGSVVLAHGSFSSGLQSFSLTLVSSYGLYDPTSAAIGVVLYVFSTTPNLPPTATLSFPSGEPLLGQQYNVEVTITNPNPVPETYSISVTQDCGACTLQGSLNWPSWEDFLGLPSQWPTNPGCSGSSSSTTPGALSVPLCSDSPQSVTVAAGGTSTLTFSFTNTWAWIAPFKATTIIGEVLSALIENGAPDWATIGNVLLGGTATVFTEQFHFNVLSSGNSIGCYEGLSSTCYETVTVPYTKLAAFGVSLAAGASDGDMTLAGIYLCVTGLGCSVGGPAILVQAGLIATQSISYAAAADPSQDYTTVVVPAPMTLANGTKFVDLPSVLSAPPQWRSALDTFAQFYSYNNATAISEERYYGALAVGADTYANIQLQAILSYSSTRNSYMSSFSNQLGPLLSELPTLNSSELQSVDNYLNTNGLPPEEVQVLDGLGLGSSVPGVLKGDLGYNVTTLNSVPESTELSLMLQSLVNEANAWNSLVTQPTGVPEFPTGLFALPVVAVPLIVAFKSRRAKRHRFSGSAN
ncbi:MAG: hypothetical protein JRN68_06240 [Nitrososphaerota archaeon]|nr:hypothetical protein [Nitrososphaerota archaeon]